MTAFLATAVVRLVLTAVLIAVAIGIVALVVTPERLPDDYDEPPSRLDRLSWIDDWEQARTPEATAERMAARLRAGQAARGYDERDEWGEGR